MLHVLFLEERVIRVCFNNVFVSVLQCCMSPWLRPSSQLKRTTYRGWRFVQTWQESSSERWSWLSHPPLGLLRVNDHPLLPSFYLPLFLLLSFISLSYSLHPSPLFLISHVFTSSLLFPLPGTFDYISNQVPITFNPESSVHSQVACASISIINDFALELQPETFMVRLSSPSPSIMITGQPSATISIWDDDSKKCLGFYLLLQNFFVFHNYSPPKFISYCKLFH